MKVRDLELELDEEKRRHAETLKILRKKERQVKEVLIQSEEDQKNVALLQESLDKLNQRVSIYKRQLQEQVGSSNTGTPSFSARMPHLPKFSSNQLYSELLYYKFSFRKFFVHWPIILSLYLNAFILVV
jgi:hypothetical protein